MMQTPEVEFAVDKRRARHALLVVFLFNGAVFASWIPQIPTIQRSLTLSPGALGLALLGAPVGFLIGTRLSGRPTSRFGSAPITRVFGLLYCTCIVWPALAINAWTLFLCLIPVGFCQGFLMVASNAHAATLQRAFARPIMATFHAFYSMGVMTGAAVGGLSVRAGVRPLVQFVALAVVALPVAAVATSRLLPAAADAGGAPTRGDAVAPRAARITRRTLTLSTLGFFMFMAEGETSNWSAIYLRDVTGSSPGAAASGYMAFAFAMVIGRLFGDSIVARFGPVAVMRVSALLGSLGMAAALIIGTTAAGIAGFALLGCGLSGLVPILFSAAANQPGVDASQVLSQVVPISFLGVLLGPPIMGGITEVASVKVAFALLAVTVGLLCLGAGAMAPAAPKETTR